ncbi:MAG TPA: SGNH/GDSL hydrolase family protein [Usitatibacter sp.]|nr:SGNH/GDSL hydrolase family protein [Usitatibacter sp.]
MKFAWIVVAGLMMASRVAAAGEAPSVLFIGNSFTYAHFSSVWFYRADTVTDLNGQGIGGMPALFKSFTQQAGIDYDVFLETMGGAGLDDHLEKKLGVIGKRGWDKVVMHGFSTLDPDKPRDPAKLIATAKQMADFLREHNPKVELYMMATQPRADETYPKGGAWHGESIEAMARDVRAAYDRAAKGAAVKLVIPVGEAWIRAMQTGVADPNPYDGIDEGKLDLWAHDHYHASEYGIYLEALVVFGSLTGRDPRSLGEHECSAFELGLSRAQVRALQKVAFDQLASARIVEPNPNVTPKPMRERCKLKGAQ